MIAESFPIVSLTSRVCGEHFEVSFKLRILVPRVLVRFDGAIPNMRNDAVEGNNVITISTYWDCSILSEGIRWACV